MPVAAKLCGIMREVHVKADPLCCCASAPMFSKKWRFVDIIVGGTILHCTGNPQEKYQCEKGK
jgi:hypothetical protein